MSQYLAEPGKFCSDVSWRKLQAVHPADARARNSGARPLQRLWLQGLCSHHRRIREHNQRMLCALREVFAELGLRQQVAAMRKAALDRKTKETNIRLRLTIEGKGRYKVSTGIRFFDHMLELFAHHGGFDLELDAERRSRRRSASHRGRCRHCAGPGFRQGAGQQKRHSARRIFCDADG